MILSVMPVEFIREPAIMKSGIAINDMESTAVYIFCATMVAGSEGLRTIAAPADSAMQNAIGMPSTRKTRKTTITSISISSSSHPCGSQ